MRHIFRPNETGLTVYRVDIEYTDKASGKRLNDADIVDARSPAEATRIALRLYEKDAKAAVVQVEVVEF